MATKTKNQKPPEKSSIARELDHLNETMEHHKLAIEALNLAKAHGEKRHEATLERLLSEEKTCLARVESEVKCAYRYLAWEQDVIYPFIAHLHDLYFAWEKQPMGKAAVSYLNKVIDFVSFFEDETARSKDADESKVKLQKLIKAFPQSTGDPIEASIYYPLQKKRTSIANGLWQKGAIGYLSPMHIIPPDDWTEENYEGLFSSCKDFMTLAHAILDGSRQKMTDALDLEIYYDDITKEAQGFIEDLPNSYKENKAAKLADAEKRVLTRSTPASTGKARARRI